MKKAIIIGASSGIGKECAKLLSEKGYILGLAARRVNLLEKLQKELPNGSFIKQIDISRTDEAVIKINELLEEVIDVDLIIICSGVGHLNPRLDLSREMETIEVNVSGFTSMINSSLQYFIKRGKGHIVGISSIAALRGNRFAPAYSASKAFISNYMEGIRFKMKNEKRNITITDIRPGFVDTDMAKGVKMFWVAPAYIAARKIYNAIERKKKVAIIPWKWNFIALLMKFIPDWLYYRL